MTSFAQQWRAAAQEVLQEIHSKYQETWIIALLTAQVALLLAIILLRRNTTFLVTMFGLAWQNYFDPHGVFWTAVVSAPLMLDAFIVLVLYLLSLCSILVRMKRAELRAKARQQARAANGMKVD